MEGIRGTTHPLQTPIILECIFSNLDLSDLKNFRLVSRAWRKSGAVAMRNLVTVSFDGDEEKIWEFLELVQNENSIFSESAFVNEFSFSNLELEVTVTEFFRICGRSLKDLSLVSISFGDDFVENFRNVFLQLCPNMKVLSLTDMRYFGDADLTGEPTVWVPPRFPQNQNLKKLYFEDDIDFGEISFLEILSHFPELEEIGIQATDPSSERIFQALATARKNNQQCWNIKTLSFDFEYLAEPQENLLPLLEGNFSLETLDVESIEQSEHVTVLAEILSVHATSLKRLTLGGSMAMNAFDAPYNQIFEKLKHLSLDSANMSSTTFLRKCPSLLTLEVGSVSPQAEFSEEPMSEWVGETRTELYLDSKTFQKPDLERLLQRLPNVEELTIDYCDNEMFSVICELLPKLTYLHIMENFKVGDAGISGLDQEDVERINEEETFGWTWWRPITVARPNLSNLKNLKSFRLDITPSTKKELRACTALCGLKELPQLKHLEVNEFGSAGWTRWI